jgi:hypothetical protein
LLKGGGPKLFAGVDQILIIITKPQKHKKKQKLSKIYEKSKTKEVV